MARVLFEGTDGQIAMLRTLMDFTDNSLPTELTGYYLGVLWSAEDVTRLYECSDEDALEILEAVFDEELTTSDITSQIHREARWRELERKPQLDD